MSIRASCPTRIWRSSCRDRVLVRISLIDLERLPHPPGQPQINESISRFHKCLRVWPWSTIPHHSSAGWRSVGVFSTAQLSAATYRNTETRWLPCFNGKARRILRIVSAGTTGTKARKHPCRGSCGKGDGKICGLLLRDTTYPPLRRSRRQSRGFRNSDCRSHQRSLFRSILSGSGRNVPRHTRGDRYPAGLP